ncbi:MAG: translation initiation factor IF-2 [Candidatus Longimicrobiales bacterium M2_2A_002]
MRVYEVAKEFDVPAESLIQLLRQMGVSVKSEASTVEDTEVAKLRALFERHRRAGLTESSEIVKAALGEAQPTTGRRRRRRRKTEPESEVELEAAEEAEEAEELEEVEEVEDLAELEEVAVEAEAEEVEAVEEAEEAEEAALRPAGYSVEQSGSWYKLIGPDGEQVGKSQRSEDAAWALLEEVEAEVEAEEEVEPAEEAPAEEAPETEAARPAGYYVEQSGSWYKLFGPDGEQVGKSQRSEDAAWALLEELEVEEAEEEAEAAGTAEEAVAEEAEEAEEEVEAEEAEAIEAEAEEEAGESEEERKAREEKEKKKRRPKRVSESLPGLAPAASAGPGGKVRIQAEGYDASGRRKRKKKSRRKRVDQDAVQENVQRVMAELKGGGGGRKRRSRRRDEARQEQQEEQQRRAEEEAKTVRVNEFLTVAELAELIDEDASDIIASAFKNLGLMVTINQRLDFDQIELLLDEFGFQAVREEEYGAEAEAEEEIEEKEEDLEPRPPVVTVMGHVDHGKTSLLDYIRKTNVIAGESGGITQHIGAYHVQLDDEGERALTFLDTPGHAAFTAMRARGADVTDVVILVVAADDSVMPQTIEAISHAKSAGVPLIVAINKMDLPGADAQRVKQELLEHQVVVEEFGGNVLSQPVSAKTGEGIDELLEQVLLQAELLELKANPDRDAQGIVIEAELDVGKGPVTTVLVTSGTLEVGDDVVCGLHSGRVRALLDERGNNIDAVGPAMPAQILGISGVPQAGDKLVAMEADRAAEVAQTRQRLEREKKLRIKGRGVKLTDISQLLAAGETAQLNVVIKGDVDGSIQALSDSIEQLGTDEVEVDVIHRGVGAINRSDVLLASTAGGVIIGFHVRPDSDARQIAEQEDVDIRVYDVIYEAIEDVRSALEGMLAPDEKEILLGAAEVRQLFKVPKAGTVAGCYVTEGVIRRGEPVRLVRDGVQIYQGELDSLKRFKDDVREVREGFECGMSIEGYNDIKVGDVIECFTVEEVARTLAGAESEQR